jgi:hypothetical protein
MKDINGIELEVGDPVTFADGGHYHLIKGYVRKICKKTVGITRRLEDDPTYCYVYREPQHVVRG